MGFMFIVYSLLNCVHEASAPSIEKKLQLYRAKPTMPLMYLSRSDLMRKYRQTIAEMTSVNASIHNRYINLLRTTDSVLQKGTCCVCLMDNLTLMQFTNCKHVCCCRKCADTLAGMKHGSCPYCRAPIEGISFVLNSV